MAWPSIALRARRGALTVWVALTKNLAIRSTDCPLLQREILYCALMIISFVFVFLRDDYQRNTPTISAVCLFAEQRNMNMTFFFYLLLVSPHPSASSLAHPPSNLAFRLGCNLHRAIQSLCEMYATIYDTVILFKCSLEQRHEKSRPWNEYKNKLVSWYLLLVELF